MSSVLAKIAKHVNVASVYGKRFFTENTDITLLFANNFFVGDADVASIIAKNLLVDVTLANMELASPSWRRSCSWTLQVFTELHFSSEFFFFTHQLANWPG